MEHRIDKITAARRQVNAAIRILFSGEDILAIYAVAAGAYRVLADLAKNNGTILVGDKSVETAYNDLHVERTGKSLSEFQRDVRKEMNRPANFLKHADKDPEATSVIDEHMTDILLLDCCSSFEELTGEFTDEMVSFLEWYFAVYPPDPAREINQYIRIKHIHGKSRTYQIFEGNRLLNSQPGLHSKG
ncbi:hypothetical protein F4212_01880 [Candidatus Poribacteria bacterium]|nr:hypothetical protein [Gammaproteobacteria bacterium]MYF97874.1 hypothetical protein [Candidatus Poribacteria bacterium]